MIICTSINELNDDNSQCTHDNYSPAEAGGHREVFVNKHFNTFLGRSYTLHSQSRGCRVVAGLAFSKWPLISNMAATVLIQPF